MYRDDIDTFGQAVPLIYRGDDPGVFDLEIIQRLPETASGPGRGGDFRGAVRAE